jgi:hypothetical protein
LRGLDYLSRWMVLSLALLSGEARSVAQESATVLFETHFERSEGYDPGFELIGQNGWTGEGSGGNGLITDPIAGFSGQVAFIGFTPPQGLGKALNVWHPIGLRPVGKDLPVVRFTVAMQIDDSSTNALFFDDFRWSVYNADPAGPHRLFTLEFGNDDQMVYYLLDDGVDFQMTNYRFEHQVRYLLTITMNFARNLWTADIGNAVLVNGAPITTTGAELSLGDIDAVWSIRTAGKPGDNFMIFDDYRITAEPVSSIPAMLEPVGVLQNGKFLLRVLGEPGLTYAIEVSADSHEWIEAGRVVAQSPSGIALYEEPFLPGARARFFRARSVVP